MAVQRKVYVTFTQVEQLEGRIVGRGDQIVSS
eukprot:COSAG02_NODE_29422_length_569_cov_1.195745_1_plen_31_part_01